MEHEQHIKTEPQLEEITPARLPGLEASRVREECVNLKGQGRPGNGIYHCLLTSLQKESQ